jgi:serine protease Do
MKNTVHQWIQRRRLTAAFLVLALLTGGIIVGSVFARGMQNASGQAGAPDAVPLHIPPMVEAPNNAFAKIARMVDPAVVNINTESLPKAAPKTRTAPRRRANPNDPNGDQDQGGQGDDNCQDFFNHFFGQNPNGQGGGDEGGDDDGGGARQALGSGFIVDPHGYIITNNHVVDKADKIFVKLSTDPDGGPSDLGRPAHVIGVDKDTDIAVIKIDADKPLPTVQLGNSDSAEVGDWVLAVGSPFSLQQTVTAGIVSARNRTIDGGPSGQFQRFIQTDAAINPGNSGGPLVDMNGKVIGMNTAIFTTTASYAGIGFAMPSNTIIKVYDQLIGPDHKVTRGSIGITFQSALPNAVKREYNFNQGVLVGSVEPKGPAAAAGIKPEDIITSIDGRQIKDGDVLVADISSRAPGSTVKLGYLRDGKPGSATVGIADRSKLFASISAAETDNSPQTAPEEHEDKLGIIAKALSSEQAAHLNLKAGVIITAVKPGSFAEDIGLQPGVVVIAINRKPIPDMATYNAAVTGLKSGDDVALVVRSIRDSTGSNTLVGGTLP